MSFDVDAELIEALSVDRFDRTIGNTPMVRISRMGDPDGAPIYVKMESCNPSGSIRDRHVDETIQRAMFAGHVIAGETVVIAGIHDSAVSTAFLAASLGLKARVFASQKSSKRLLPLIERYGATVAWVDEDPVKAAAAWARGAAGRWYFDTRRRDAVQGAYGAIAAEILKTLGGVPLAGFVTSVTTGGTFRFVSELLRETHPMLDVRGARIIENVQATFKETSEVEMITLEEIWKCRDEIARTEGLLLGPKGAACVRMALNIQSSAKVDHAIVAINPDSGQRYLGWEDKSLFTG